MLSKYYLLGARRIFKNKSFRHGICEIANWNKET